MASSINEPYTSWEVEDISALTYKPFLHPDNVECSSGTQGNKLQSTYSLRENSGPSKYITTCKYNITMYLPRLPSNSTTDSDTFLAQYESPIPLKTHIVNYAAKMVQQQQDSPYYYPLLE
ncbi:hypothetical protein M422DRAFT_55149 [Sphaerobolus stellatus SS14]|uniref:Uncharacterized protein n=1 Tax=Sphaerobolus stellatus (strain SS14) TaxID=990650 RepID=A0A0C9UPG7_SPHS4|nr:hypothetical protein M422DRAFT_55149 [Sphaerobolus stellatus SS14]